MKRKSPLPVERLEKLAWRPLLAALVEIGQLKNLYRQGWLRRGIPPEQCESVADHVFGMTWLAWLVMDAGLGGEVKPDRVLRMVLAHEIGEIYVGDVVPADGVSPEEKRSLERAAVERVAGKLERGSDILALWEEFEEGQTAEARLVRQLDRLEMALQAAHYGAEGHAGMDEFFTSARQAVTDPDLAHLLEWIQTT